MIPNPPNPFFSKCVICDKPISDHTENMVYNCFEALRGVLSE